MIFVRIEVGSDHDTITEFSPGQCLLSVLAIHNRIELDKYFTTTGHIDTYSFFFVGNKVKIRLKSESRKTSTYPQLDVEFRCS